MTRRLSVLLILCSFVFFYTSEACMGANYLFGVFPSSDPKKISHALLMLSDYLSQATGDDFSVVVTKNYDELLIRMREGSVDLACLNTVSYIKLRKDVPDIKYLATFMEKSDEDGSVSCYYRSYIIALKDRGFSSIKDLKGGTFAFVSKNSTSGYIYPKHTLKKMGINPSDFFGKVFYLNRHDRVVKSLVAGSIDAGAVSESMYRNAVKIFGDIFEVLSVSEPIPYDLVVAGRNFPSDRVKLYRDALVRIPSSYDGVAEVQKDLGWNVVGLGVLDESFYDRAEEVMNAEL